MATNPIKYGLRENSLTPDPDDCMAQVVDARVYTQEDITKEMIKRGSSLTEADLVAYQKLEAEVYADIIENGGNISTPLISTTFSITGVFTTQSDSFDKARHAVKLNVNAGSALREAVSKTTVQKVETASTDPFITSVSDKVTGDSTAIKAGSVMEVTGSRLKFDPSDPEQGVFALTASGEVRCATVIENKPSRLFVLLPADIGSGEFTVEVRTRLGADRNPRKNIRKGIFSKTLTALMA